MAQLKDKNGLNVNPKTTAEEVSYDSTYNVKQKIQALENQEGGGGESSVEDATVVYPNLFDPANVQNGIGLRNSVENTIEANGSYSCVFIPLEYDTFYCYSGYDWLANDGYSGSDNIALAKQSGGTFTNLLVADLVENAAWLDYDSQFKHGTNIYRRMVPSKLLFKTPSQEDMVDPTMTIYFAINIGSYNIFPVTDTLKVCESKMPVYYPGSIRGKNIAFFGDSITAGTYGGFVNLVVEKLGLNIVDNFASFASRTPRLTGVMIGENFRNDVNSVDYRFKDYNRYDAVVIQIGTNPEFAAYGDMDAAIPDISIYDIESFPYTYSAEGKTVSSAEVNNAKEFFTKCFANTFYGNIAAAIEWVRYINPNCRIFLTIPPHNVGYTPFEQSKSALINLAQKMSVEIIDAGTYAGMANWNINYWAYNMGGGEQPGALVHFTLVGNEMWASYIANELDKKFYETEL